MGKYGTSYKCAKCGWKKYYGVYVAQHAIKKKPPIKCINCDSELVPVA